MASRGIFRITASTVTIKNETLEAHWHLFHNDSIWYIGVTYRIVVIIKEEQTNSFNNPRSNPGDEALDAFGSHGRDNKCRSRLDWSKQSNTFFQATL